MNPRPYGNVEYADPGYQKDGKSRYPIDSEDHVRAAWSYINQADNSAKYTRGQLQQVRQRIMAAMRRFDIDVYAEAGKKAMTQEDRDGSS